jgi:methionine-rich copper-binding protein CopC
MSHARWTGRAPRAILSLLTVAFVVGCVAIGAAASADAHDVLVATSPANGAQVATVPPTVTLRFDQTVLGLGTEVVVTGPSGPVQLGKASVVDNTVTERLQPGAPAGRYTVDWRVTSVDGHPVSGTFAFTASAAGAGRAAPSSAVSGTAPTSVSTTGSSVPWFLMAASALLLALIGAGAVWSRRRSAAARSRQ